MFNFNELKTIALRCKKKSEGKMIDTYFRLHYDELTDTVNMYQRDYSKEHLFSINSNDEITLTFSEDNFFQSDGARLQRYLSIYVYSIPTSNPLRKDYKYYIHNFKDDTKHVYFPNEMVFKYGKLIKSPQYRKSVIDKNWNNKFTKLSRKRRAEITALNRMIPNFKDLELSNYSVKDYFTNNEDILDFILYKPITKDNVISIRNALNTDKGKEIRTLMQKFINDNRLDLAKKAGKVNYEYFDNRF